MDNNSKGVACVFSLKNPAHPEFICLSNCAVLCIDMNPCHPHMMVVGLMDANVAVYNLQVKTHHPVYISDARNGKHKRLINQVNVIVSLSYQNHFVPSDSKVSRVHIKSTLGLHTKLFCSWFICQKRLNGLKMTLMDI